MSPTLLLLYQSPPALSEHVLSSARQNMVRLHRPSAFGASCDWQCCVSKIRTVSKLPRVDVHVRIEACLCLCMRVV
jgi:hypothetical protein